MTFDTTLIMKRLDPPAEDGRQEGAVALAWPGPPSSRSVSVHGWSFPLPLLRSTSCSKSTLPFPPQQSLPDHFHCGTTHSCVALCCMLPLILFCSTLLCQPACSCHYLQQACSSLSLTLLLPLQPLYRRRSLHPRLPPLTSPPPACTPATPASPFNKPLQRFSVLVLLQPHDIRMHVCALSWRRQV